VTADLSDGEAQMLRAIFIASESGGSERTTRSFRYRHRDHRSAIDALARRGYVRDDGSHYRLTLRGLQVVGLDGARDYIAMFNDALPVLQALYGRSSDGECAVSDLVSALEMSRPVDEQRLQRALSYLLPDLDRGAIRGWSGSDGRVISIRADDPILDSKPFEVDQLELPTKTAPVDLVRDGGMTMGSARGGEVDLFVSHSSRDERLVSLFVDMLVAALGLKKAQIRCTSVPGCRLPAGTDANDAVVDEIGTAKVFIALLTKEALHAPFVLFEMGARRGQRLPLIPVLGPGANIEHLPTPIANLHALKTSSDNEMHQLLADAARALRVGLEPTPGYLDKLSALVAHGRSK
jgi:hypothetical protein